MRPHGPKIAEGRDSEIYEHGPGRVMRIPRQPRSLEEEAAVMTYVRSHGYPVPEVFDAGEGYLVMERVDGPTLLDDALPFRIPRSGKILAELHDQLHQIPAPAWLERESPLPGDRVVHRDLHPLNVLVTPSGPTVIDWSNASRGDPAFDVADTWTLFMCADPTLNLIEKAILPIARKLFLRAFLRPLDRAAARQAIPAAVEHRLTDPNLSSSERERMRAFAHWATIP